MQKLFRVLIYQDNDEKIDKPQRVMITKNNNCFSDFIYQIETFLRNFR